MLTVITDEERVRKWKREGCEHNSAGSEGEPLVLKGDCPECWNEFMNEIFGKETK